MRSTFQYLLDPVLLLEPRSSFSPRMYPGSASFFTLLELKPLLRCLLCVNCLLFSSVVTAQTEHIVGDVRVQVLSPTLVRIELKGPQGFENRETFHITQRQWRDVPIQVSSSNNRIAISTAAYTVNIPANASTLDGISIVNSAGEPLWQMPDDERYVTIKDRWKGNYLFDNGDAVSYGPVLEDDRYFWTDEYVDGFHRFRNKATGEYLNIENLAAYAESTPVQEHWHSKDWSLRPVEIDGYFFMQARWVENPRYLHIEDQSGYVQHAPPGTANGSGATIDTWTSAQWAFEETGFFINNRQWIPHPEKQTKAWAIVDTPRVVPAVWGYNYPGWDQPDNGWDLSNDAKDVYVFLPAGDGKQLRQDYLDLTGRSDLLPLYALGGWDSRYYAYTQAEALQKIDSYREKNIPLDVFVVDTDWRVGASTGYGVDTGLFPDMQEFLADAHAKNVRVPFNDHPEPKGMALDPVEVNFRNQGLRGLFDIGLDFWWFDRNWHITIDAPDGINKETFGMYVYHWVTQDYYPNRRPIILANIDGIDHGAINNPPDIAAHRYTLQWTGDTMSDFASLKREIRAAVYSGVYAPYAYTSTDLGGHKGTLTVEQYARWVQFGALSPIFRLHCGEGFTRDPWDYAAPAEDVVRKFVQMRMRLLPVLYAAARENYDSGEPILRRLDLQYPEYAEASRDDQYLLGDSILVAPIAETGQSRVAWIPPGSWINVWTGDLIQGPLTTTVYAQLEQMPVFVKRGSLLALVPTMQHTEERAWDPVTLDLYPMPGQKASTVLYEDDGRTNAYKQNAYRKTQLDAQVDSANKSIRVNIAAANGYYDGALEHRSWKIRLRTPVEWVGAAPTSVLVNGEPISWKVLDQDMQRMPFETEGSAADGAVIEIELPAAPVNEAQTVEVSFIPLSDAITIFQHCNYTGWAVNFPSGDFSLDALLQAGVVNNDASSLKVPSGFSAILFDEDNFSGNAIIISNDVSCLVDYGFNDVFSSLQVTNGGGSSSSSSSSTSSSTSSSSNSSSSSSSSSSSTSSSSSSSSSSSGGACAGVPQYVDGRQYNTGDSVQNIGNKYSCLVGGWCTVGGPYEPGVGWAWDYAWHYENSCS
ncbi:Oligosaccharide 4-alpha-D-glucosyltransferase [Thalassocella blandensis]|nr:Oligosaccharide 4-alpha-D-glucosyltransferase [Thalassocella blandensis]